MHAPIGIPGSRDPGRFLGETSQPSKYLEPLTESIERPYRALLFWYEGTQGAASLCPGLI